MVTNGMEPRMRQREYVTKFGSRNKGFEFKSPSDEEDGARLYPGCLHELDLLDLYEEHETSKQKRSKHLYRCWCVVSLLACVVLSTASRPLDPFVSCPPFLPNLSFLPSGFYYHNANPLISVYHHSRYSIHQLLLHLCGGRLRLRQG